MRTQTLSTIAFALTCSIAGFGCAGDDGSGSSGSGGGNVGFGGAQDIGQFRGILETGGIPGERTLDANGFFAEHYSESPPADCGDELCITAMTALGRDWITGQNQPVVQVSLTTPLNAEDFERRPLDLIVVVDTSGSMSEQNRMGYAIAGLHELIDSLNPSDRMALITYDSSVQERTGLVGLDQAGALHTAADSLYASGATNLYGGLERGLQLALGQATPGRQARVMLLSDGIPTAGETRDEQIMTMAETYMADGIGLTTIGVGLDFHVELMRGLAERGAGNFYFLEDAQAIAEVFREELDYFVTPIAYEVEIAAESQSGWSLGAVTGTRYWSGGAQFGHVTLPAAYLASRTGDAPTENGRRGAGGALFLALESGTASPWEESGSVARITLRYRSASSGMMVEQDLEVEVGIPAGEAPWLSHESMSEHYAMYNVFLGLRSAARQADWSAYNCALTTLGRLDGHLSNWQSNAQDPDLDQDRILIARFAENLVARGAVAMGEAYDSQCTGYDTPTPPYDYDNGYNYNDQQACSAAGTSAGGLVPLLMAVLLLAIRRSSARPR